MDLEQKTELRKLLTIYKNELCELQKKEVPFTMFGDEERCWHCPVHEEGACDWDICGIATTVKALDKDLKEG